VLRRSLGALVVGLLVSTSGATSTARAHGDPAGVVASPSAPAPRLPARRSQPGDQAAAEAQPELDVSGFGEPANAPPEPEPVTPGGRAVALAEPSPPTTASPPGSPEPPSAGEAEPTPQGSGLSAASRAQSVNPTAEGLSWEVPVSFAQSYNLRGFRRDSQLTYDPTYTWTLSVSPRWNVRERVSLGARQDMTLELTESDITSRQRQVWLDDTRLDVRYTMEARPRDVTLTWLGLLRLPTSLVSQGAKRSVNLGGGLLAIRPVDVLSGLVFYGLVTYRAWLSSSDVVRTRRRDAYACDLSGVGSTSACEQAGGVTTTIGTLSLVGQALLIPKPRWTLTLALALDVSHAHRLSEACVTVDTSPEPVCFGDAARNHIRTLTEFSASVGYDFRDYLTLTLAYVTLAYHPDFDGARDHVVWNELTTLSLTLSFRLGGFVAERREQREAASEP
jgi:hypothetical protein